MRHTTPSMSWLDILRWKCPGAEVMPDGNLLKQNFPNGVINIVSRAESFVRGICQKTGG